MRWRFTGRKREVVTRYSAACRTSGSPDYDRKQDLISTTRNKNTNTNNKNSNQEENNLVKETDRMPKSQ